MLSWLAIFYINQESLVTVRGGAHMSGVAIGEISELGLTSDAIRVVPRFIHREIHTNDFGPEIPAEVMWNLADVMIHMQLIHFDRNVLDICLGESMGKMMTENRIIFPGQGELPLLPYPGVFTGAGITLGRNKPIFASGCHLISLTIESPELANPWHFRSTYLTGPPMEFPLGSQASLVNLNWRAIPYGYYSGSHTSINWSVRSSGVTLWDNIKITNNTVDNG